MHDGSLVHADRRVEQFAADLIKKSVAICTSGDSPTHKLTPDAMCAHAPHEPTHACMPIGQARPRMQDPSRWCAGVRRKQCVESEPTYAFLRKSVNEPIQRPPKRSRTSTDAGAGGRSQKARKGGKAHAELDDDDGDSVIDEEDELEGADGVPAADGAPVPERGEEYRPLAADDDDYDAD